MTKQNDLSTLFQAYVTERLRHKKIDAILKASIAEWNSLIKAKRLSFKDSLDAVKSLEAAAKIDLETEAISLDITGRHTFENSEWLQRSPPKSIITVVDIPAFLESPLAPKLISSIVLKQDAARVFIDDLSGIEVTTTEAFKYHIKEDLHE